MIDILSEKISLFFCDGRETRCKMLDNPFPSNNLLFCDQSAINRRKMHKNEDKSHHFGLLVAERSIW